MRLALACGRLDIDNMLAELTEGQWDEWEAADRMGLVPDNRTPEQKQDQAKRLPQSPEQMAKLFKSRFGR